MSGPIPARDAERRRSNTPAGGPTETIDVAELASRPVEVPVTPPEWHAVAQMMFDSLKRSAQASLYEPSDWAVAYLLCESLSMDLEEQVVGVDQRTGEPTYAVIPLKGASLAAYLKGFASILATEGDRRRLRIEIERDNAKAAAAPVLSLAASRAQSLK